MPEYPNQNLLDLDGNDEKNQAFRIYRVVLLVLLVIAAFSLLPFYPADMDYFAGGVDSVAYPNNLIGAVGAHFGWACLVTLGLAAYPLLFLAIVCCLRRLLWRKKLLPRKWDYLLAIPLFGVGVSLMLGIWPTAFEGLTTALNIRSIPGGVVGQLFCAPGHGLIHRLLSTFGCFVIAATIIILTLSIIWKYDWMELLMPQWEKYLEKRRADHEAMLKRVQEEELARMQQQAELAQQQQAQQPWPQQPQSPQFQQPQQPWPQQPQPAQFQQPQQPSWPQQPQPAQFQQPQQPITQPQEVFATQISVPQPSAEAGFRMRRGQASIDAARQAAEAIYGTQPQPQPPAPPRRPYEPVVQQPPLMQPELPQQPVTPMPAPAPVVPPPQPMSMSSQQPMPSAAGAFPEANAYTLPQALAFYQPLQSNKQELDSAKEISDSRETLQRTLDEFGMDAEVVDAIPGPQVTLYEIQMGSGVPLSRLGGLQDNLSMALRASRAIRMLLPIPGKDRAGIEVPNRVRKTVCAHELFSSDTWTKTRMHIPLMLGKNINGGVCMLDLQKAPHLLVAGATGSGKSVCMNLMIQSMLLRFPPDKLKLILFDPKFLEFAPYSKLPHLVSPIINEADQVAIVLNWACREMDKRYKQLAAVGVKQLDEFNARPNPTAEVRDGDGDLVPASLPYLVIIIDELADIIARAKKEVDVALGRLAGKARAAGIHMIVATQRPSSDVITGVIKSNFPQRIALQVTDQVNSRVILDSKGAENLLGQGDMLYSTGAADCERIQCGWVTNDEIASVANACASQDEQHFDESLMRALEARNIEGEGAGAEGGDLVPGGEYDEYTSEDADPMDRLVKQALGVLERTKRPTISIIQRQLRIGYNKAADVVDELETRGYIGPQPISGLREIYWDNFPGHGGGAPQETYEEPTTNDGVVPPSDAEEPPEEF